MLVYRIAKCLFIGDLSGRGAALYGGSWNNRGIPMLYTAGSISLATLEVVVHLKNIVPPDFCRVTIDIPDDSIIACNRDDLPLYP
ncbi:MAG: RES domain-containing protein [Chitinophagia bacterium]|nr:RES domain-containing protein [Chitinophagia bacterium]